MRKAEEYNRNSSHTVSHIVSLLIWAGNIKGKHVYIIKHLQMGYSINVIKMASIFDYFDLST